jgi:hypothetical protein
MTFPDRAAVLIWMQKNQTGRRTPTPQRMKLFRAAIYESTKQAHGGDHGNQYTQSENGKGQNLPLGSAGSRRGNNYRILR